MEMVVASTVRERLRGLIGRPGFKGVMLLVPCHDIHTFGMRQPLDVAFVAQDGTVIESYRNVAPRRRLRNRDATATLERFASCGAWPAPGDRITKCGKDLTGAPCLSLSRQATSSNEKGA